MKGHGGAIDALQGAASIDAEWDSALGEFADAMAAGERSRRTITEYTHVVIRFRLWLEDGRDSVPGSFDVTEEQVAAFLWRGARHGPFADHEARVELETSALKQFYRFLGRSRGVACYPFPRRSTFYKGPPPAAARRRHPRLDELLAFFDAITPDRETAAARFRANRDRLFFAFLAVTGLRAGVALNLDRADLSGALSRGRLECLTGHGALHRVRLGAVHRKVVRACLDLRRGCPYAVPEEVVFAIVTGRLGASGAHRAAERYATAAGVGPVTLDTVRYAADLGPAELLRLMDHVFGAQSGFGNAT